MAGLGESSKKKKKKKETELVSRKSSFFPDRIAGILLSLFYFQSLSHTHKYIHTHTHSLSSISLFILLFCLSFYWMVDGCCSGSLFYFIYLFIFLLCWV